MPSLGGDTLHVAINNLTAQVNYLSQRSVALYTHEFWRLLRRVPTLDKGTALHWFVKGLEPDTSKEVKLRQPPTDMDIDILHIAINNLTAQINYLSQGPNRNHNTPRPAKLTPAEKAHLIANGALSPSSRRTF
ncbi:hypothetical protein BGZ72_007517 [Mortierella alpina]|nr:hypothetical protein BGZ72_007517 [Mortierella alpina]